MKKKEIVKGGFYTAKVSNQIVIVRVDEIRKQFLGRKGTVYDVTNMRTKRVLIFRSAQRFRAPVGEHETSYIERMNRCEEC